jgi:hypothetical protein
VTTTNFPARADWDVGHGQWDLNKLRAHEWGSQSVEHEMRALSGHHFVSNLMFGSEHQIAKKTAPLNAISRTCVDFISDLMFGSADPNIRFSEASALI